MDLDNIWLPRSSTKHSALYDENYRIIGKNLYEGTGLILPKCGRNPYLSGVDMNVLTKTIDDDCFDISELTDELIIEEMIASLCQFMTHYTDDICSSLLDYRRLYEHVKLNPIHGITTDMIPDIRLLEEIRDDRFPLPEYFTYIYDAKQKHYESQPQRLALVNNFIHNLWTKFTKYNGGALSGGYIPDYISQMGWNIISTRNIDNGTKNISLRKQMILGSKYIKPASPRLQHIMSGKQCINSSVIPKSPRPIKRTI